MTWQHWAAGHQILRPTPIQGKHVAERRVRTCSPVLVFGASVPSHLEGHRSGLTDGQCCIRGASDERMTGVAGHTEVADPQAFYDLSCGSCHTVNQVPGGATEFACRACAHRTYFLGCDRCKGANVVLGSQQAVPNVWHCDWCLTQNATMGLKRVRLHRANASQAWQTLDHHGLTRSGNATLLGGFELVHGHGDCPPPHTLCSIAGLDDGILVIAEVGARGRVFLPYTDLLDLEVGGHGTITSHAGMIGGGSGIYGMAKGMAIAGAINTATRKTTVDSYLRVSSLNGEMLFSHWKLPPAAVRAGLGRAFVGHMTALRQASTTPLPATTVPPTAAPPSPSAPSPLDELERLTKLHAAGTLTDTEFQLARDIQVKRMQQENS